MAVTRCENGHFYDNVKFSECPHCKNNPKLSSNRSIREERTVYRPKDGVADAGDAPRQHIEVDFSKPVSDERTVGIFRTEKGYDPVVGWLVCVDGKEKGRDYRLHAGRNFIGRALKSDVVFADDERVSREDHCSIVFEPNRSAFIIARGRGDGVLVDGERLAQTLELKGGETIEIGASQYVFVPFCGEDRAW